MKLIVNGENQAFVGDASLADVLRRLNVGTARVATVVNDKVVPAERRDGHALKDGDRVEILCFAGGG